MSRKSNRYKRRAEQLQRSSDRARADVKVLQRMVDILNGQLRESKRRECPDFVRSVVIRCEQEDDRFRRSFETYMTSMSFQPHFLTRMVRMLGREEMRAIEHELHYIAEKIGRQAFDTMLATLRKDGVLA
jgi:hypothetical protein